MGCISTITLAFTSYESVNPLYRYVFWVSLVISVLIILYSGINGLTQSALIEKLAKHRPFQLKESEKLKIKSDIAELITKERENGELIPEIQFLSFSGQSTDAMELQEFIRSELEKNGRKTKNGLNLGLTNAGFDGETWDGFVINVNDAENPPMIAQGLIECLTHMKIKAIGQQSQGYGENHVVIYSNKPSYTK